MKNTIQVLDKGEVEYIDHMGSDLTVCNAARVSFNKKTEWDVDEEAVARFESSKSEYRPEDVRRLSDKDQKLIKYLAKHDHWTPFAHPQITLKIKAPISIRTQFFKHKQGFVENEISRRYVSSEPEFYIPKWRGKPTNGAKQGSDGFLEVDKSFTLPYTSAIEECKNAYDRLIRSGVSPEQARFVLPQGMYTEWYWTGSLAAYARFYRQRSEEHAQWEIREYAEAVGDIVRSLFPFSWNCLMLYTR